MKAQVYNKHSFKGHFNMQLRCWCYTMIECYQRSIKRLSKGLRSVTMSPGEYMSFSFGPLSNRCPANQSQYWLLLLRQLQNLELERKDYGFSCPVICTGNDTQRNNSLFSQHFVILNSYSELSVFVICFSWPWHLHSSVWSISKSTQLTSWSWRLLL